MTTAQDEVDKALHFCMRAMYQPCEIMDWNFSYVDVEATDWSHMSVHATLYDTNQWNLLRAWVTRKNANNTLSSSRLDYLHYTGHGSGQSIGNKPGELITLGQLRASPFLKSNYMTFVALDGCNTMDGTEFIQAMTGYAKTTTRFAIAQAGTNPHFGCGWDNVKVVGWMKQGVKKDEHFWFWEDFYHHLTRRNPVTGLMDRTYQQAYAFAKEPQGAGVNNNLQTNPEATGFKMVGCTDCRFDERPGIVQ